MSGRYELVVSFLSPGYAQVRTASEDTSSPECILILQRKPGKVAPSANDFKTRWLNEFHMMDNHENNMHCARRSLSCFRTLI
ncbi:hypothetical protein T265_09702 [Opisthorchis viverrini]|uniref:Uncharacterized protein n=1 Tax=Opisthorchis viverrini TaxID=6198 RepID=A0A075A428_OPIVI|nr:hypothetical protein T265_09702 [Opisthorchis viverrini]KER22134.1 hypothetical protein T265_09702 [Opisthorchis viverrini]